MEASLDDTTSQQTEARKNQLNVIKKIFEINKETISQISQEISDLFKDSPNDCVQLISNAMMHAAEIRPKKREELATLFKLIGQKKFDFWKNSDFFFTYIPKNLIVHAGLAKYKSVGLMNNSLRFNELIIDLFEQGSIGKVIANDDIQSFQASQQFLGHNNISCTALTMRYTSLTPIQLAAYLGSTKCFKYMISNGIEVSESDCHFAIEGGEKEIIELFKQKGFTFRDCITSSVIYHRDSQFKWLRENFPAEYCELSTCLLSFNYDAFLYYTENGFDCGITELISACRTSNFIATDYIISKCSPNINAEIGFTPLHAAVETNNMDIINCLIKHGAELNVKDSRGNTPLLIAAKKSYFQPMQSLLKHGADADIQNNEGKTALHVSVEHGFFDAFDLLLKHVSINIRDNEGETALFKAVQRNNDKIAKTLITSNCSIEGNGESGSNIFHIAAQKGNYEIVKCLVENKHDVNTQDNYGMTPLHYAAQNGHEKIVKYLIDHSANINKRDSKHFYPLHYALKTHNESIKSLLKLPESSEKNRKSLLFNAAEHGNIELIKAEMYAGISLNIKNDNNWAMIHLSVKANQVDTVKFLAKQGADINIRNGQDNTALHIAAEQENVEIVKLLLSFGAKPNILNFSGLTPLHIACDCDSMEIAEILYSCGNIVDFDYQITQLHFACFNGSMESVEFLLSKGVDIDALDSVSNTPLHYAAWAGNTEIVQYLVENDCQKSAENLHGIDALTVAEQRSNFDIVNILQKPSSLISRTGKLLHSSIHSSKSKTRLKELYEYLRTTSRDWIKKSSPPPPPPPPEEDNPCECCCCCMPKKEKGFIPFLKSMVFDE